MNKKQLKFQLPMSILVFVLVFAITWQVKGVRKTSAVEGQVSNRIETLQSDYQKEVEKNEELLQQIIDLQGDIAQYREQVAQSGGAAEVMRSELTRAEMLAGLTDVEGSGITVTLKDGNVQDAAGGVIYDENYGIVHDSFVLMFLNELRAAGAEALSINDERILATSEIRCAGPTISINNTKKSAPFEIKAIGDPDTLENALKMPGGAIEQAKFYGIDITLKRSNKLTIKKYTGSSSFKYATTVTPEEEGAE